MRLLAHKGSQINSVWICKNVEMAILSFISSISCLFSLHNIANFSSNICSCVKRKNQEINICVIWESFQKIWVFVNNWMHLNTRKMIENWHSDALRNFCLACEIVKCLYCYKSRRCSPRLRIKAPLSEPRIWFKVGDRKVRVILISW